MRGGKRPNAGRKRGAKDKLQKAVAKKVESIPSTLADGLLPLDFMLEMMRADGKDGRNLYDPVFRLEAAKAAAPYVHKKQPQDVNVAGDGLPLAFQIITPLTKPADGSTG